MASYIYEREKMDQLEQKNETPQRVLSIDALRGFDMFWIVGGGAIFHHLHDIIGHPITEEIKNQLQHVRWEGFRFEDLIMPLFLFICGLAMPYSFAKRLARGDGKFKIYCHVLIRVVILWLLGMIKQGDLLAFNLEKLDLYSNTLQAIAAGYLISAIIILEFKLLWQVIVTAGLLLLFWGLMMLVPIPEYGIGEPIENAAMVRGMLEPKVNLAIYLDHKILGEFQDGTSYAWILASMVFGATTMTGVFAGRWLRAGKAGLTKALLLIVAGLLSIGAGLLWSLTFPIIKHLWTSSFVLFSSGICIVLLGLFYLVIDVWGLRKWAYGFIVLGSNAIFVYMSSSFIPYGDIANRFVGGLNKWLGDWAGFTHATVTFALTWLLLWYMFRKKTFIKI